MKKKPDRPYELIVKIGADNIESIVYNLNDVAFMIREANNANITEFPFRSVSGSSTGNCSFSLIKSETIDHDSYLKQLELF
jgi:hypothetical protein